jgi:hypothetical protein
MILSIAAPFAADGSIEIGPPTLAAGRNPNR